jgi:exodeoxyribonuclease X
MAQTARIFDIETTGHIDKKTGALPDVVEAAWLELDEPPVCAVIDRFEQRYNPTKRINLGALATHHIHPDDLVDCPSHTNFALPPTDYLIGHNVDGFDWIVIGKPPVKLIDTLALARMAWPSLDSHTQSALLYYLKGKAAREVLRSAHSALADVGICREILLALLNDLKVTSWQELHELSEHALVPVAMPFGKHAGVPLSQVPRDYVKWLLNQPNIEPRLRAALTK